MLSRYLSHLTGLAALLWAINATAAVAPCPGTPSLGRFHTSGWGIDHHNTRLQSRTDINAANVSTLEVAWVYGYANDKPRSMPLVSGDTVFVGDSGVGIVALDRDTGCERWRHEHKGEIASAILPIVTGDDTWLLYADRNKGLFVIRAENGAPVWQASVNEQPVPMYSGNPLIAGDRIFQPLSSLEIGLTFNPLYGCCTTSGGMAALNTSNGEQLWYTPTIQEPPHQTGTRLLFIEEWGPSGAPVWGAPMYDPDRDLLYYGTGQNYSHPTTDTSDAIFAVDGATGEVRWIRQFTENDAFNMACSIPGHPNCPDPTGPDVDFGAPPVLVTAADGKQILIVAQKSSDIHALDPDTGEVIWQERIGRGGALGGIHWGIAADPERGVIYIPVSDIGAGPSRGEPRPGMFAYDITSGELLWEYDREAACPERRCAPGFSAAITVTRELVFAGALDGAMEALNAASGERLWHFETATAFTSVNNVETRGGAIDAHGPVVFEDLVLISSGYNSFGEAPGNALVVFRLANP